MIYIFPGHDGSCSVVFDGSTLSDDAKARAIVVEALPVPETPAGKTAILKGDKTTSQVWYDYVDAPVDPVDQRIADLEEALAMLHMEMRSMEVSQR